VNELVRGKRGVTPATAWSVAKASQTSPEFSMKLQVAYELSALETPESVEPIVAKQSN
jgi:plasmid maintenance system antidote protein VapI